MANDTREEVHKLLIDEHNFSTRAGLRLVLTMLMEIDDKTEQQAKQYKELEQRMQELKKRNLILWIMEHKYLTALYSFLAFIVSNAWFVSGFRKPMIIFFFKHAFGVTLPPEVVP